jgi:hypothetical protein
MGWYALVGQAGGSLPLVVLGSILASVGLLFGLGMGAVRLSRNARHFHEISLSEQSLEDDFEIQAQKYLADLGLREKNEDELRHSRIPRATREPWAPAAPDPPFRP